MTRTNRTRIERAASAVALAVGLLAGCGSDRGGPPASPRRGTVHGRVTMGPMCPVEQVGKECPPRPLVATVTARSGARAVESTRSAADGTYRLELASGTYTITASTGPLTPRCAPRDVQVAAGRDAVVDIDCDTGIR